MDNDLTYEDAKELYDQNGLFTSQVRALQKSWLADTEKKLEWFGLELLHYKEKCRELEIELTILQGAFDGGNDEGIDLFQFKGRTNFS